MKKGDSPGVYLPPPLVYVLVFFLSILLQRFLRIEWIFPGTLTAKMIGLAFIALGIVFIFPAIWNFIRTRNTLITIKPASSLQTRGVFAFTRNPMYLGLLLVYTGIAFIKGNGWTFILLPCLVLAIRYFIIRKEEQYLEREFGTNYHQYRQQVRRWI